MPSIQPEMTDLQILRLMLQQAATVDMLARRRLKCNQTPLIQEQAKKLRQTIHIAIQEQMDGTEG